MEKQNNPHDAIFKNILASRDNLVSLLANFLPEKMLSRLSLEGLVYEQGSFVPDHLKEYFSDLLVSMPVKGFEQEARVYFLFEHKSTYRADLVLQLLHYMYECWSLHRKNAPHANLPIIIPVVITHAEKGWKKLRLSDIVMMPDESFRAYLPDFDFVLYDCISDNLDTYNFEIELKCLFMLWRDAHKPHFMATMREFYRMVKLIEPEYKLEDFLRKMAIYLYSTRTEEEYVEITRIADEEATGGKTMRTIAEMLEQKGYADGILAGKISGKTESAQEMLLDVASEQYGYLPLSLEEKIKSLESMSLLRSLARQVLKIKDIDEFSKMIHKATEN